MEIILAFDPSGAYHEGKGTTGWCVLNKDTKAVIDIGSISAKDYPTDMQYYAANVDILRFMRRKFGSDLRVVFEDYVLYAQQAVSQTNSHMETCQLLGILKYNAFLLDVPYTMQMAHQVVNRWSDSVLRSKGIMQGNEFVGLVEFVPNDHEKDAYRHALHFATFDGKEPKGEDNGLSKPDPSSLRGGTRSRSGLIPRGFCYATEDGPGGE